MSDIYFFDKQMKDFIYELYESTKKRILSWKPLDDFLYTKAYEGIASLDLISVIYADSNTKCFKEDSFFLSKNNSLIILIHISQTDQNENDNFILYGALNKFEHIICMSGLSKFTELQRENAEKIIDLCHLIKFQHGNNMAREKDEMDSVTNIIRNILSD